MGLSLSLLASAWEEIVKHSFFDLTYNISFSPRDGGAHVILRTHSFKKTDSFKKTESETTIVSNSSNKLGTNNLTRLRDCKPENVTLDRNLSFKGLVQDRQEMATDVCKGKNDLNHKPMPALAVPENSVFFSPMPALAVPENSVFFSPRPVSELDAAAVKLQKVYKSYRTRRNLADCAVVVEELWWKALDFAALKRSSVSFFNVEKPETAVSRWARARTRAAKVGKGLSKDEKAQKLALQHWLEAIDPRHRYGHNLHFYYDIWFESESSQPFFYWLDVGHGKEMNVEKCPRPVLHRQCIKYLGPIEREAYEVVVENGKLLYRQSGVLVNTIEGSKWIFVLSTTRSLYVGQKKKGQFQHSSFLSGGATTAAGRLVAHDGILEAIWPYSGHYHPTEENFMEFISFLEENHVDLSNVKRCAIDDDYPSMKITDGEPTKLESFKSTESDGGKTTSSDDITKKTTITTVQEETKIATAKPPVFDLTKRLSCKWTSGTGPRIGCVRDYPAELQTRALEQVNLSPRVTPGMLGHYGPIPSPRPSPKVRLSPRLAYMGLPSPRTQIPTAS